MIVAKMFVQNRAQHHTAQAPTFDLTAVCRGEENKDWAAATPSGRGESLADSDGVLAAVFESHSNEVLVYLDRADDGSWKFERCSFTHGGCEVVFVGAETDPYRALGRLTFTINARAATEALRREFAESLITGAPSRWCVAFAAA